MVFFFDQHGKLSFFWFVDKVIHNGQCKINFKSAKKIIRRSRWTFKILTNRICVKCFVKIKWNSYLQTAGTWVNRYCIQLHWMTGLFEWYIGMKKTNLEVKVECLVAWQQPASCCKCEAANRTGMRDSFRFVTFRQSFVWQQARIFVWSVNQNVQDIKINKSKPKSFF